MRSQTIVSSIPIIVDNDVPEIFNFPPVNRRMFVFKRLVDSCNCFSDNRKIPLNSVFGSKISQIHLKSYTSCKIFYVADGFENILE